MIQFITHQNERYSYEDSARLALEGGCKWIQLRMKNASEKDILRVGHRIKELCTKYNATFILDDHVELVKTLGANGVHVGKNDMPVKQVREILGNDFIIGATANTYEDVEMHYKNGANYIGCGPFRFTTTKKNLSPILGTEGYKSITDKMKAAGIKIPIVAIGGITKNDINEIMQTGVTGIALSGAVLNAQNPAEEMKTIINLLNKWTN